ncbi:MAG TPA: HAD family hydrolase [Candidatus Limnocylindria bacterium]|nr:HAD family hydrolase [Candidatus Limnocylindria bacterium]
MKALLVDLDDTLLDYSGGVEECWQAACVSAAPGSVDQAALLRALAETRVWFWSDPARHRRERTDMLGAWTRIAAHALERCGGAPAGVAEAIGREFAARRRRRMQLFPEALGCLRHWRARGIPLALVTNGDAREQRWKIDTYGLAPFFDVMVIEGEFGAGKPDEIVYRHALQALGVRAEEAWMVGDHLEFDVEAPQRLGARGVWVDRAGRGVPPGAAVRPYRVIQSLTEL